MNLIIQKQILFTFLVILSFDGKSLDKWNRPNVLAFSRNFWFILFSNRKVLYFDFLTDVQVFTKKKDKTWLSVGMEFYRTLRHKLAEELEAEEEQCNDDIDSLRAENEELKQRLSENYSVYVRKLGMYFHFYADRKLSDVYMS